LNRIYARPLSFSVIFRPGKTNHHSSWRIEAREDMNMRDRTTGNVLENAAADNRFGGRTISGRSGRFYFQRFFLVLLLILFLPVSSSVAENIKCSRLPLLMRSFLAHHYAIKDMNTEINDHSVDQMIKRLDPSKTLFYESDVQSLKTGSAKRFFRHAGGQLRFAQAGLRSAGDQGA